MAESADTLESSGPSLGRDLGDAVQWAIGGIALLVLLVYQIPGGHQETIAEVVRVFLSIVLEALPFMLIGALVGGLIEVFVSAEKLSVLMSGRHKRTVLIAAAMGLIFPVCECAIVPVVRRLLRKGIPVSAAVAFLLAGPIVNPIVAASTLVAYRYDWRILLARMGLGYGIAVVIGLLMGRLFKDKQSLLAGPRETPEHSHDENGGHDHEHEHDDDHDHEDDADCENASGLASSLPASPRPRFSASSLLPRLAEACRHAADDFVDIGRFLVIGALVAGILRGALNQSLFLSIASNPAVAIPAMMAFAFTLTLCSEADAFVAASFKGVVPLSAQIAFLVLGPMLDIKLLLMYTKLLRKRVLAVLTVAIILAVLLAATLFRLATGGQ